MQATPNKFTVVNILDFDSNNGANLSPLNGYNGSLYNFGHHIRSRVSLRRESIAKMLNHGAKLDAKGYVAAKDLNPLIAVMCQDDVVDRVVGYIHDALGDEVSILAEVRPDEYTAYLVKAVALKQVHLTLVEGNGEYKEMSSKLQDRSKELVRQFEGEMPCGVDTNTGTVAILINPQLVVASASNLFKRTWIRMGNELLEADSLLSNSFVACDQFESITKLCITCKYSLGECMDYTANIAGYPGLNISNSANYSSEGYSVKDIISETAISEKIVQKSIDRANSIVKKLSLEESLMCKYGLKYVKPVLAIIDSNTMLKSPNIANVSLSEENVLNNIEIRKGINDTIAKTRKHKSKECSKCSIKETCYSNNSYKEFLKESCTGAVSPPKNVIDTSSVLSLLKDSKDVYKYMVYLPGTKLEKTIASNSYSNHLNRIRPWASVTVASVTHATLVKADENTYIIKSIKELSDLVKTPKDYCSRTGNYRWSTKGLSDALSSHTTANRVIEIGSHNKHEHSDILTSSWVCRLAFAGYAFNNISEITVYLSLPIVLELAGYVYSEPSVSSEIEYHSEHSHVSFGSSNPLNTYGSEVLTLPIKKDLLATYTSKFGPDESIGKTSWSMVKLKDQIQYLTDPLFDANDADLYLKATNITHRAEYTTGGFGNFSKYEISNDCLLLLYPRLGGVILTSPRIAAGYRSSYLTAKLDKIKGYGGSMLEPRNIILFYKWNRVSVVNHQASFNESNVFRKNPSKTVWRYLSETFPVENTVSSVIHACEMSGADSAVLVPAKTSKKFAVHGIKSTPRYNSYRKIPTSKSEIISVLPGNPLPGFTKLFNHITNNMVATGSSEYRNNPETRAVIAKKLITELHILLKVNIGYRSSVCDTTGDIVITPAEIPYVINQEEIPDGNSEDGKVFTLDADILEKLRFEDLHKMQRKDGRFKYHKSLSRAMHLRVLILKNNKFIPTQDAPESLGRVTRQSSIYEIHDGLTGLLTVSKGSPRYWHAGIIKSPSVIGTLTTMSNLCKSNDRYSLLGLYNRLKNA